MQYLHQSFVCPLFIEEEDELHFPLQCRPVYNDLRLKYLHLFDSPPKEKTFQKLLATEDVCLIQGVSLYIYHAFRRRENCIFDNNQPYVCLILEALFVHYCIKCVYVFYL